MAERYLHNPDIDETPKSADIVIIGGGPAGSSALWALERKAPNIKAVLIEQGDTLGSGASTASIENFRTAWPTESIARSISRSVEIFTHADEYLGEGASRSLNIKQHGYLYCGFNQREADCLKSEVESLKRTGFSHIEFLDRDEVAYRYPWLGCNVVAAKVDPHAGWLDSNSLINLFVKSTKKADVLTGVAESKIIVENGKIVGVKTPNGLIKTEKVVIAAGAQSKSVAEMAGIHLPIVMRPRQSFVTTFRHIEFPTNAPFIIGSHPTAYTRPTGETGAIFGWAYKIHTGVRYPGTEDYMKQSVWPTGKLIDLRFPSMTLMELAKQFGHKNGKGFSNTNYLRGVKVQAGYYVYRDPFTTFAQNLKGEWIHSDSERPIIDAWPGVEGLFLSTAFVGHGVMFSAAGGEILASKVLGEDPLHPLFSQFDLDITHVATDGGEL